MTLFSDLVRFFSRIINDSCSVNSRRRTVPETAMVEQLENRLLLSGTGGEQDVVLGIEEKTDDSMVVLVPVTPPPRIDGSTVTFEYVHDYNDEVVFEVNDSIVSVTYSGRNYEFSLDEFDKFVFINLSRGDSLHIKGTDSAETASWNEDGFHFESERFTLATTRGWFDLTVDGDEKDAAEIDDFGYSSTYILGGGPGFGISEIFASSDSVIISQPIDDPFPLYADSAFEERAVPPGAVPEQSSIIAPQSLPDEYTFEFNGFGKVDVYSDSDKDDSVVLVGSTGNDYFYASADRAHMRGEGYRHTFHNFKTVTANSDSGLDRAYFYETDEAESVTLSLDQVALTQEGYSRMANGFTRVYAISQVAGENEVTFTDSEGDDLFVSYTDKAYLSGQGTIVYALGYSHLTANASSGGNDRAYLYDSEFNDSLTMTPASSTLTHSGYRSTVNGFERVTGVSRYGGTDVVLMEDSVGDDEFKVNSNLASMMGDGYANYAKGFASVTANAYSGGRDVAYINDTIYDDRVMMSAASTTMTGSGGSYFANGFDVVYARSRNGGNDTVTISDSAGDDHYYAFKTYSYLVSGGVTNYAVGFNDITMRATHGGFDRANLHDSPEYEELTITPESTTLTRAGYRNQVIGFDRVYSDAGQGGGDVATIMGSTGDDHLVVRPKYTYLHTNGIESYAIGYKVVHAYANGGGNDRARFIDSPYGETFIEMGNYAQYHTAGSTIYVHDFDSMRLYGTEGGVNRIRRVHRLDAVYTTIGDWLLEYV